MPRLPTDPLQRSALALVASTALAAVGGFGYWVLAARMLTVAELGQAASVVSALLAASTIGQANAAEVLARRIPGSPDGRVLLARTYAVVSYSTAVVAFVFVAVLALAGSPIAGENRSVVPILAFVAACVVWSLFTVQDSVLAAVRRATWVPVENAVYSLAKLGVLAATATGLGTNSVLVSWVAPVPLAVVVVTRSLWGWLGDTAPVADAATVASSVSATAADAVGTVVSRAAIIVVPIVVASVLGSDGGAAFYVPYSVVTVLYLAQAAMAVPLTVEGAIAPERLGLLLRQMLSRAVMLSVVAVIGLVAGGPILLRLYGGSYADTSLEALGALALCAIPRGVLQCHLAALRVEQHGRRLLVSQVGLGVAIVAGTWIGAARTGVSGAAVGVAAAHGLVAVCMWPDLARRMAVRKASTSHLEGSSLVPV